MTIAITGADGFVGRALVARLISEGERPIAFVRSAREIPGAHVAAVGDIREPIDWAAHLLGVDAVVHLAARVHVLRDTAEDPQAAYWTVNVAPSIALARAAASLGARRFVLVSTIKVHGERTDGVGLSPESPTAPADWYARSKLEAERQVAAVLAGTRTALSIVRPTLVYGAGAAGNVRRLLGLVRRGVPLPLGAVTNRRSMIALDNLVDLLLRTARDATASPRLVLGADAEPVSTRELVEALAAGYGRPARLFPVPVSLLKGIGAVTRRGAEVRRLVDTLEVREVGTPDGRPWTPPVASRDALAALAASDDQGRR